jgi:hypothetical protein
MIKIFNKNNYQVVPLKMVGSEEISYMNPLASRTVDSLSSIKNWESIKQFFMIVEDTSKVVLVSPTPVVVKSEQESSSKTKKKKLF